jgi:threonine synthase
VSALIGLQCHLCKTPFPAEAIYVCDRCLGPLEPVYDYVAVDLTRAIIEARPKNLWRYRELLPITGEPRRGFNSGFTALVRCERLASRLWVSVL